MIYECINPSDQITFIANSDKIAYAATLIVFNTKAGCDNKDTGVSLPTLMLFHPDPMSLVEEFLGMPLESYLDANSAEIADALKSFAYLNYDERKTYDAAIAAITDPDKLAAFKADHEDRNRTSMSAYVNHAWKVAEHLLKNIKNETT